MTAVTRGPADPVPPGLHLALAKLERWLAASYIRKVREIRTIKGGDFQVVLGITGSPVAEPQRSYYASGRTLAEAITNALERANNDGRG